MADINNDEISFVEIVNKAKSIFIILKKKIIAILLSGILFGSIAVYLAYINKPEYKATLTFAIEEDKAGGGLGGTLGIASQLGFDLGGLSAGSVFSGANLIELMKSRALIEKTLLSKIIVDSKEITLAEHYLKVHEIKSFKPSSITFPVNQNRNNFTLQQDSLLGIVYKNIAKKNVQIGLKDKKLTIVELNVSSVDELFSKVFAERLVSVVSEFYITTKTAKASNNFKILQKQADSIRAELNAAISGVAIATDQTYNLNPALNINRVPSTRRQIDVQANSAILVQVVQNLELAKVSLRKETPLIQIIDSPILPLEKKRSSKLIFLLIGGFLGVAFSSAFILLKNWVDNIKK